MSWLLSPGDSPPHPLECPPSGITKRVIQRGPTPDSDTTEGPDPKPASNVEAEVDHVTVTHDVVAPFDAQLARFAALGFAAERDQIFPPDHFGLDEAALEIGVNRAGGLRRGRALEHR